MPLVRVVVRNEYGLGKPELYREEVNKEDPKAVLDGVAVAGLVGILRQLGDLAQFAAEVFHGLQEQVMSTSSRSHKLRVRVQRIEAALPPLEKAILAQKSHLHFAYTAGSDWHARLQNEQNHFIHGDLPQFIMDYYEECRTPPRLHLLDKFDTGGPGSCLKRYSDPNYFRGASVSSGEANVEKGSKDKKARRSKKKRTWHENEVSHGASISNHTDGFASIKVDEQISPQTMSLFDSTLKSNLGDQSNSFDSATGSGHIECVFHPTSSLKPDENETKESSFSSSRLQHNDALDSASVDECSTVVNDNFPRSLSPEQTGPSSSYVTWYEKTEIVESMDHQYDRDETAEICTTSFDGDTLDKGAVIFGDVDQIDFQFDNEDTPTSISGQNQLDDVESEPDNYMDALNSIESESETDLECKTKREVEQPYDFNDDRTQDGIRGLMAHHSDLQPSNLESHTSAYSSSNEVTSFNKPSPIFSESYAHEESPQMAGEYSNNGNSLGMDPIGQDNNLDGSNVESDVSNSPYSGTAEPNLQAPVTDEKNINNSCEPPKSRTEPSAVQSVKFWTNGGLLGLEPSKPPVFSVPTTLSQESVTRSKNVTTTPSSQSIILGGYGGMGKPDQLVQDSKSIEQISAKCFTSSYINLDAKHKKDGDSNPSNGFDNNYGCSLSETNAVISEIEQVITPDVKAISTEANQRDGKNASQMFGLSNRFLLNGFQRNASLVHDEKSEPPSLKTDVFEQKSRNPSVACGTVSEGTFKGYFVSVSPINSPSSSPPLQHMKISFQPVNGFETSKLKLEFPDGSYRHDSSIDVLPSFQLVPWSATTTKHDIGSDSDDDTFCRSSPYLSDDCLSHHSNSNSEQWESDYTPTIKDNDLYDAFRRISSTDSVSSSQELGETGCGSLCVDYGFQSPYVENCLEPCQSGCTLDLPNLSTMNPLYQQEMKNGLDTKDLPESHFPEETTPRPPPPPPLEWRVMKPLSDVTISKQDSVSESLNHDFDTKNLGLAISPQAKQSTINQQNTGEVIAFTIKCEHPEWQKPNGQREVDQAGRGIDEKEDFLHQIRTKSVNLRRTTTEKPTVTPGPSANVKVTAILEKANAIRQAVGSDDDTWSDA